MSDFLTDDTQANTEKRKWCRRLMYALKNDHPDLPRTQVQAALRQAFDIWQNHAETDVIFYEVHPAQPADIELFWEEFDQASSLLARAEFPPLNCDYSSGAGRIWFNLRREWTFEERKDEEEPVDFITLAAHEIGHALGMEHCLTCSALMQPIYQGSNRFLAAYDIGFYRYLYYDDERPPT